MALCHHSAQPRLLNDDNNNDDEDDEDDDDDDEADTSEKVESNRDSLDSRYDAVNLIADTTQPPGCVRQKVNDDVKDEGTKIAPGATRSYAVNELVDQSLGNFNFVSIESRLKLVQTLSLYLQTIESVCTLAPQITSNSKVNAEKLLNTFATACIEGVQCATRSVISTTVSSSTAKLSIETPSYEHLKPPCISPAVDDDDDVCIKHSMMMMTSSSPPSSSPDNIVASTPSPIRSDSPHLPSSSSSSSHHHHHHPSHSTITSPTIHRSLIMPKTRASKSTADRRVLDENNNNTSHHFLAPHTSTQTTQCSRNNDTITRRRSASCASSMSRSYDFTARHTNSTSSTHTQSVKKSWTRRNNHRPQRHRDVDDGQHESAASITSNLCIPISNENMSTHNYINDNACTLSPTKSCSSNTTLMSSPHTKSVHKKSPKNIQTISKSSRRKSCSNILQEHSSANTRLRSKRASLSALPTSRSCHTRASRTESLSLSRSMDFGGINDSAVRRWGNKTLPSSTRKSAVSNGVQRQHAHERAQVKRDQINDSKRERQQLLYERKKRANQLRSFNAKKPSNCREVEPCMHARNTSTTSTTTSTSNSSRSATLSRSMSLRRVDSTFLQNIEDLVAQESPYEQVFATRTRIAE